MKQKKCDITAEAHKVLKRSIQHVCSEVKKSDKLPLALFFYLCVNHTSGQNIYQSSIILTVMWLGGYWEEST